MNYTFAEAVTRTRPVYVMKAETKAKKNCFVKIDEVPMTEETARRICSVLNYQFRKAISRKI